MDYFYPSGRWPSIFLCVLLTAPLPAILGTGLNVTSEHNGVRTILQVTRGAESVRHANAPAGVNVVLKVPRAVQTTERMATMPSCAKCCRCRSDIFIHRYTTLEGAN